MRDNRLDVIRGFALLLLITAHTFPGPIGFKTFGHFYPLNDLAIYGTDVFVSLSGLVCGIAYLRVLHARGVHVGILKGLVRALQLFLYNAFAFLCVAVIVLGFQAFGVETLHHSFEGPFWTEALGTLLLFDPITYFNILNLYIVFLVLVPFFIAAQMRSNVPILASLLVYVIYTVLYFAGLTAQDGSGPFFVSFFAWQFLFFGGAAIGINYQRIREMMPPLSRTLAPILCYFVITFFMRDQAWIAHRLEDKSSLGLLHLTDLVVVLYVLDQLISPSVQIKSPFLKSVSALGSNSLFFFSFTLVQVYFFSNILAVFDNSRPAYITVIMVELFMLVWLGKTIAEKPKFRELTQIRWVEKVFPALR